MKKKFLYLPLLVLAFISLSACSSQNTDKPADSGQFREFKRPDFGQPEEPADIRGLVSDKVGNEIKVLKIEQPPRGGEERTGPVSEADEEDNGGQALSISGTGTRMPGMGGGPGMRGGERPVMDEDAQTRMLERMKEMASGEETVLIPVGIRMLKPDTESDSKEPVMIEASLEDVKENSMLQIWLDESVADRNIAEFVLIMS